MPTADPWLGIDWQAVAAIAGIFSAVITAVGLFLIYLQIGEAKNQVREAKEQVKTANGELKQSGDIARGEFYLHVDEQLWHFEDVSIKLRRNGGWWYGEDIPDGEIDETKGPRTDEEREHVVRYMGIFERTKFLMDRGMVDPEQVVHFYGRRLDNLVRNRNIRRDYLNERFAPGWRYLIELWSYTSERRLMAGDDRVTELDPDLLKAARAVRSPHETRASNTPTP
jgi:hypothetical protein